MQAETKVVATSMISDESPAVARRRLRLALRRAREARGLTQQQVADAFEWSLSKVNRIEGGEVAVSNTDLQALLHLFGVTDPARTRQLLDDARASRRRGWWDQPRYREHLTPATVQLLQFESQASAIRVFQPTLIPGVLQTPNYAETIINYWGNDLPAGDRAPRLEVRVHRAEQVFGRPDPPQYLLVIDETVLIRPVGGPKVMAEQLHELLSHIRDATITVRVLPLVEGAMAATHGPFTIFDLGDEENAVLYRESSNGDEIIHGSEAVLRHRRAFEQMWEQSLDPDSSMALVRERAAAMLSAGGRGPGP
jgi:transcriptional regulator with XRE-family HTH domain